MKIKLKTLNITTYDIDSKKQYRFVNEMADDPLICQMVTVKMAHELIKSHDDIDVLIGSAYIVCDEKKLVGYLKLAELDMSGVLTIHYAVHPDYRHQGYGTKILKETIYYAKHHIDKANSIRLYINKQNNRSILCAEKAGYIKQDNYINDNPVVYIKKIK